MQSPSGWCAFARMALAACGKNSGQAVRVNIEIMRAFVRLRRALTSNKEFAERMEKVEKRLAAHEGALGEHADAIRSVFEDIRGLMGPPDGPKRRIGF